MEYLNIALPFFQHPMQRYGVRELGRLTRADTKTVMKHLRALTKKGFIVKRKETGKFPYYEANRTSLLYRHEKSEVVVKKFIASGVVDYLLSRFSPKAIVLFGSIQKGTYHAESDVDIFVQAPFKKVDLSSFERKVGHKISLFCEPVLRNLSKGLLTNLYNGLVLAGTLEVLR